MSTLEERVAALEAAIGITPSTSEVLESFEPLTEEMTSLAASVSGVVTEMAALKQIVSNHGITIKQIQEAIAT